MKKYDHNSEPRQLSLFGDENVESQEEADEKVDATYDLVFILQQRSERISKRREWQPSVVMPKILCLSVWRLLLSPTMASRHQCAVILSFLPNMPQAAVAEVA